MDPRSPSVRAAFDIVSSEAASNAELFRSHCELAQAFLNAKDPDAILEECKALTDELSTQDRKISWIKLIKEAMGTAEVKNDSEKFFSGPNAQWFKDLQVGWS